MILYPVALFQQKIVITNKILHLSPKLCLWVSFIHFTLSSVRNIFSLLLCNIQLSAQSIHLIQFNTDLWTRENKTARSTKWQEIKGILIKQTVQRHKPASHLLSAIAVTSSPNPNTELGGVDHSRLFNLVSHLCNQCNWSSSEWPRSKGRLPRKTPGSSSKHKRRSKSPPLVWPSADIIWKLKTPLLA